MTSTTLESIPPTPDQDEGVLRDVLEELDRERTKRAEVEAQLRKVTAELESERAKPPPDLITPKAFRAMEVQLEGFRQIVDALTMGKPAIAAAAVAAGSSDRRKAATALPLHVVRLLEVIPWDPRAQEHILGIEEIYEWQVYDERENKWQSNLRFFPPPFRSLPVVNPHLEGGNKSSDDFDRSLLLFLAGGEKQSTAKHGVITNEKCSILYKISDGYSLPNDGGRWEWIGGWQVDKDVKSPSDPSKTICDNQGWCYGLDSQSFILSLDNVHSSRESDSQYNIRRRKWIRRRILTDYPLASERTRQYLKLCAENARLFMTATKLSEQLGQTKHALTDAEARLAQARVATPRNDGESDNILHNLDMDVVSIASTSEIGANSNHLGSKITQWVRSARKASEDLSIPDSGKEEMIHDETEESLQQQKFPWAKIGRGGLIEKIAKTNSFQGGTKANIGNGGSGAGNVVAGVFGPARRKVENVHERSAHDH